MKAKRRIIAAGIILLLVVAGAFSMGFFRLDYAFGQQVIAENVHIEATLLENGDLRIEETSTFRYKDRGREWWNFYRTFEPYGEGGLSNISLSDISVYDHDYDREYTCEEGYVPTSSLRGDTLCNIFYVDDRNNGHLNSWQPIEIGFNFPPIKKASARLRCGIRCRACGKLPVTAMWMCCILCLCRAIPIPSGILRWTCTFLTPAAAKI